MEEGSAAMADTGAMDAAPVQVGPFILYLMDFIWFIFVPPLGACTAGTELTFLGPCQFFTYGGVLLYLP